MIEIIGATGFMEPKKVIRVNCDNQIPSGIESKWNDLSSWIEMIEVVGEDP